MKENNKLINNRYLKIKLIGEGAYGKVYAAYDLKQPSKVYDQEYKIIALKKLKRNNFQGIHFTTLREIKILKELKHNNIIEVLEIFLEKKNAFISMEYCPYDLAKLLQNYKVQLSAQLKQQIFVQILSALNFLHSNWVIHRDIKPANILISQDGQLKLSDFGFARFIGFPNQLLTQNAVTINYRAPEIFFGSQQYNDKIDVWAAGCILVELFYDKQVLFEGTNDINVLQQIFKLRGTPDEKTSEYFSELPNYKIFEYSNQFPLQELVPLMPQSAVSLAENMLCLNPINRYSIEQCLKHNFCQINQYENDEHYQNLIKDISKRNIQILTQI